MNHNEFVKDAIESYEKLPQERSEIYKRYFVSIPPDIKVLDGAAGAGLGDYKNKILEEFSRFNTKFDVVLGDGILADLHNPLVRMEGPEYLSASLEDHMHKTEEDKYVSYIHAFTDRCVVVDVPDGQKATMNMLMLNSTKPLNVSIFVKVGNNSKLNIFQYFGSDASAHSTLGAIQEIRIGNGSEVEINALHNENSNTVNLSFTKNRIGEDSHLRLNSVYNGASHTRVRNVIEATEKGSKVDVSEVMFGSSEQKFDIGTYIVNRGPHTSASLESKAALMDKSFCIMKGFAKIEKGATKAKSYVHERGILLDKGAKIDGLPDMSVDENDVKATHSSATAPVDPESVFYLMSKGIDEIGVRRLLVSGFFSNSMAKVQSSIMRELSMSVINSKLETKSYGAMPKIDARNLWITADAGESDMFKGHYKYRGD
ncbi:MAG: SufD family Fe-S cluster assembly protein [Candidatus Micrarchaeaceae archaeon]|jgi:Fe-S cluster assembly protein SufD|nr:SufD family Fe-S cluster assembly protein [Candidatus Micrarchaeota archaeon]HII09526.1 SufD family Fe-S cluster assembly protein [Candidatus Micrarchaeota archaeon]